ncbi:MAG: PAS domain S-box protein [Myxococcales bacterium]|nr:PAS domain S-box protein [Myxococcales bacterium]
MRVLLLEDDPADERLLRALLSAAGSFEVESVTRLDAGLALLDPGAFDAVLLSLGLASGAGLAALRAVRERAPLTPVVVMDADDSDEAAAQAVHEGAQDHVVKDATIARRLPRALRHAAWRQQALLASETRYRRLAESNLIGVFESHVDGRVLDANDAYLRLIGYSRGDLAAGRIHWREMTPPEWAECDRLAIEQLLAAGVAAPREKEYIRKDGSRVPILVGAASLDAGRVIGVVLDLSERKRAEERLRQQMDLYAGLLGAQSDLGEGVVLADAWTGQVLYVNDALCDLHGRTAAELSATVSFWEVIAPEEPQARRDALRREASGDQRSILLETVIPRRDGTRVDVEVAIERIDGQGGIKLIALVRDIRARKRGEEELRGAHAELERRVSERTAELSHANHDLTRELAARKRIERALRESEERFRLLVEGVRDYAMVMLSPEGHVASWNQGLERIHGYRPDEIIGQHIARCFTDEDVAAGKPAEELRVAADTGRWEEEGWRVRKDGVRFWAHVVTTALRDESGSLRGYCKVTRDITERRRAEEERAQLLVHEQAARRDAEVASRTKDEFLAMLSHELRSPLTPMLGWTRLLRAGTLAPPDAERALESVERNAKSLAQLIQDLLDVSRIITGKLRLETRPVDLESVIDAAIDSVRLAADAKRIAIARTRQGGGVVSGDADRLRQVVWNLLSNAIKFTPEGGRVEVRQGDHQGRVLVQVIDNGSGIPVAFLPHVFERFRQADNQPTRSHGGLGLGLAIVRHLVELHGGTVHAESPGEGCGAVFTVTLPAAERLPDRVSPSPDPAPAPDEYPSLAGLQILVLDDEPDARGFVRAVLEQCGAVVTEAGSVAEALIAFAVARPDAVVSDIAMPGEDGYSFIKKLRSRETSQGSRVPAVALTAHARAEDRTRALKAGFQTHLPKPIDPLELALVVAHLVGRG